MHDALVIPTVRIIMTDKINIVHRKTRRRASLPTNAPLFALLETSRNDTTRPLFPPWLRQSRVRSNRND
jgi:hypothetical protein